MTAEQNYIIYLLKKSLGVPCEQMEDPINIPTTVNCIKKNGILLTVYNFAPAAVQQILRKSYYVFVRQSILQEAEGNSVLKNLSDEGLDCIALKGWELKEYYPDTALRQMNDLDILVRPYEHERIKKVMDRLGYAAGSETSWKHDLFVKETVMIEMHKRLTDDSSTIRDWENEMWERTVKTDGNIYKMSDEDYYIFHFVHLHKDFMNGSLGLRRIVDTWLLDRRGGRDMGFVKQTLEKFGMWNFHESMVKLARATMGDAPMDEGSEFLLEHAFRHGIYGSNKSYKAGRIAAMGDDLKKGKRKSGIAAVFLPYKRMKAQFPVLEKWPILLPWCWMKRIFRFMKKGNVKEQKKMLNYSDIGEKEFEEMKKFFEYGGV